MSWFGQKLYTEKDVLSSSSEKLPCNFQIGSKVWLHLFNNDNTAFIVEATIAGVNFSDMHEIKYDLYFGIGDGICVRVNDFRGFISKVGEYLSMDGGLILAEDIKSNLSSATIKKQQKTPSKNYLSLITE